MTDPKFKYPAYAGEPDTKTYRTPPPVRKRTRYGISSVLKAISAVMIFVALVGGSCAVLYEGRRMTTDNPPISAQNITQAVAYLHTSTAQPTDAPAPTRTLYPTFSPTIPHSTVVENAQNVSDNTQVIPIIQYVDRFLEVTRIVTVVVPATPEPKTNTPVPTWTLQPTVNMTQEYGLLELSAAKRQNVMVSWGAGIAIVVGTVFIIIIAIAIIRDTWRHWKKNRIVSLDGITETQEEITNMSPVEGVTLDDFEKIRLLSVIRINGKQYSGRYIQDKVYGFEGGAAYEKVDRVLEYLSLPHPTATDDQEGATQA